jgi:MoaA/NifB/PqqE/SkfB family radical SAM enzyme
MSQKKITLSNEKEHTTVERFASFPRLELASMSKFGFHKERVNAYLKFEKIFPVTLELDLTSKCTRACTECPSATASHHHTLSMNFVDRLFGCLEGCTTGLLFTGGEPTMAPLFPKALKIARQRGFIDIAVVTNGSLIDDPRVTEALLKDVTTIRLSMYDWDGGSCEGIKGTLRRIEALRKRIDREGSELKIGISALTSKSRIRMLGKLAELVRIAGAHWIYFHPLCTKWGMGCPEPTEQDGVIAKIDELQKKNIDNFQIFVFRERYESNPLEFDGYHAAHFLLVIGADGKNYLGPEVKYQPQHVIADLGSRWNDNCFLWKRQRISQINSVKSSFYSAIKSKHRGVLYNHLIERVKRGEETALDEIERASVKGFYFPHIL